MRGAFTAKGHYAMSCDLLPTEREGLHYQGDVRDILHNDWDMIIAHPACTYLCNSGVRWLYDKNYEKNIYRWLELEKAREFFMLFYNHPCEKKCIENPIPHKHANLPKYTQSIQPYQFGHSTSKRTCLWLTGLSPLVPTNIIPKDQRTHDVHRAAPGPDRWKDRSRTFEGIAKAMADQWG